MVLFPSSIRHGLNDTIYTMPNGWNNLNQIDITRDIMCEVDPSYLFYQNSAEWINETIKAPKFIIIFRKPIERALSHYLMSSYKGYEDLTFIDALEAESNRLKDDQNNFSLINHSYLKRGDYVQMEGGYGTNNDAEYGQFQIERV